jgi:predicted RNase H-like HicB family nuclease
MITQMNVVKVNVGWASDGFVNVWTQKELFAGGGNTIEEAIEDMRKGMEFHVEVSKEEGCPYPAWLDGPFELALEYDVVSMLQYTRGFIKDTKLAELTGISAAQIGRYANEKAKPRAPQRRKIVEGLHKLATQISAIPI